MNWRRNCSSQLYHPSFFRLWNQPAAASHRRSVAGNSGLSGSSTMLRTFSFVALTLAAAVVFPIVPVVGADHEHGEHFLKCAKACTDCQLSCDSCFAHCLELLADGKKDHLRTAQLCADCA